MQNTQGIVKRPIITEKATMLSEQMNRFTFEVIQSANKIEIKNAIERMYGVQVTQVRTANFGGGKASTKYTNRGIVQEKARKWKKAIVTVAQGETIDLFNNYFYTFESPGGWNIIGNTPLNVFDSSKEVEPNLINPGDSVTFKRISKDDYLNYE